MQFLDKNEGIDSMKSLPREKMPHDSLQTKVIQHLKEKGLLKESSYRVVSFKTVAAYLIVAMVCAAAGFAAGRSGMAGVQTPTRPMFALLLHGKPGSGGEERVKEYAGWIRKVRESGRIATGEKLRDDGQTLQQIEGNVRIAAEPRIENETMMRGYFIIEAEDYSEAARIAADCPHLKYGGIVEIRQLER